MTTVKDNEFRTLTDEERQALIDRARRELPELDRRIAHARADIRRFISGEWRRQRR